MAEFNPARDLEIHWAYLKIASTKGETFAENACVTVVGELQRMQRDYGLSQGMVDRLTEMLQEPGVEASTRAGSAASLIREVLDLSGTLE